MNKRKFSKFANTKIDDFSRVLGGYSNVLYLYSDKNGQFLAYFPGKAFSDLINRFVEKDYLDHCFNLNITSQNIYFDYKKGRKIQKYIPGTSINNLTNIDYNEVARLLKTLHESSIKTTDEYKPFQRLIRYEKYLIKPLKKDYLKLRHILFVNKEFLEKQTKVPCHNDVQKSNIIRSDNGIYYLIDFEFAGLNDPIYDIASFGNDSVSEGYTLLKTMYPDPSLDLKKRYYLWRIFVSLQWYDLAMAKYYRGLSLKLKVNFQELGERFLENAKEAANKFKQLK